MSKKIVSDEIDLLELILILWKDKIKIFIITALFVIITLLYQTIKTTTTAISKITAITEIRPVTSFDEAKYEAYNFYINKINQLEIIKNLEIKDLKRVRENINKSFIGVQINKMYLLELFIDQIRKNDFISEIVKKSHLIKKENYESSETYEKAINELVNSIKIVSPEYNEKTGEMFTNWKIQFDTQNIPTWNNFLKLLDESANKEIQLFLRGTFEDYKASKEKLIKYEIEDIEIKILDELENYKKQTVNRIAFLTEQAAIARELDISKTNLTSNTLRSQTFSTESGIITNLRTETPYYMRGYEMIEKEIDLIKNRDNQKAFNDSLIKLESKKNLLSQNKDNERIQSLLNDTPIIKSNSFSAAKILFEKTTSSRKGLSKVDNNKTMIISSGIIGVIFGIFYVVISAAIQKRKKVFK